MHEISIAENLKELVLEAAEKAHLSRVSRITVCFGQMVQIVPDIFKFAFSECVRDTMAMGAELDIEIIPVKIKCRNCMEELTIQSDLFMCGNCESDDIEIIEGKELFVKSIEGE